MFNPLKHPAHICLLIAFSALSHMQAASATVINTYRFSGFSLHTNLIFGTFSIDMEKVTDRNLVNALTMFELTIQPVQTELGARAGGPRSWGIEEVTLLQGNVLMDPTESNNFNLSVSNETQWNDGTISSLVENSSEYSSEGSIFIIVWFPLTLIDSVDTPSTVVPIPAAIYLMGSGLLGLMGYSRKRKAQVAA